MSPTRSYATSMRPINIAANPDGSTTTTMTFDVTVWPADPLDELVDAARTLAAACRDQHNAWTEPLT